MCLCLEGQNKKKIKMRGRGGRREGGGREVGRQREEEGGRKEGGREGGREGGERDAGLSHPVPCCGDMSFSSIHRERDRQRGREGCAKERRRG